MRYGLALLLVASGSFGVSEVRAEEPAVDIPFERYRLANGLEVVLHRDPKTPIVVVNVWYHVGSGDEQPGKTGFAHLFEHMMFQGSKHTGNDVHFPILQEIGASDVNGSTNSYRTNYFEAVPAHQVETALWLESDRMGYLLDSLTEESFRNQVDVVRNERRQSYDNVPYGKARFAVAASLYPEGDPYRFMTIGRHEDLVNASLDDVRAFFRTWYAPANATLVVAGDFDPTDMKALVAKWFEGPEGSPLGLRSGLPPAPKPAQTTSAPPPLAENVRVEVPDEFAKLEQIQRTWIGPPAFTPDSYSLDVLLEVLAAEGWGRLSKRLVIQDPVCTSVRAYFDARLRSGEIVVIAQLKPGTRRKRVLEVIDEELERLQREAISAAELRRVLVNTESAFVWGLEDLAQRADQLQFFNHFTGNPGFAGDFLAAYRAVTPEAALAVAKTWLSRPHSDVVTVPAKPAGGTP